MRLLRRLLLISILGIAVLAALFVIRRRDNSQTHYLTATVDRGPIIQAVAATGVLQAVTTVQVGSQVSGNIESLGADFNSVVHQGQVIARLDPSLFEARVAQMQANQTMGLANVERARANVADAKQKYDRARELAAQNLIASSDLDSAQATFQAAQAQVKADQAAAEQSQANLHQAQVDLAHTIIRAPIDGVVINRSVDVGQTVAASFQAPVLFVIAGDLRHMQVNASIDEADIGQVRQAQSVTFTVDAYPDRTFSGKVEQIRLQPVTEQNVVTYNTIISVENEDLALLPGMTATVSIIIEQRPDAVRLQVVALRFHMGALRVPMPPKEPASTTMGRSSRGTFAARSWAGGGRGPQAQPGSSARGFPTQSSGNGSGRPTVVFTLDPEGRSRPAPVHLGISDGEFVEVLDGLEPGAKVITGIDEGWSASPATQSEQSNPFAPQRPQPRVR
jgi:HlyD family secretion protein